MERPRQAPAMAADELCRIEFSPTSHPADTLVQDFNNFKRSAGPSRFLTYRDGSWVDLQGELFYILRGRFLAGITTFEATINGTSHLFDFLRLSQTNTSTGERNSIAWIDVHGQCFFPRPVVADKVEIAVTGQCFFPRPVVADKVEIAVTVAGGDRLKRKRSEEEEQSDESTESSTTAGPKWPGTEMLREGDKFYKVVEELFLSGIRGQAPEAVITSVHRCSASGRVGNSRLQRFQMQLQKTKAARGDANMNFGWYGASAKGIAGVIAGGFARTNDGLLGLDAHGVGVHLSPALLPYTSCVFAEPDSNGERHLVLCRMIMGKSEKIPAGSQQFRSSSDQFDSGVDDLENPQWYIMWDAQKNTHIHPEYVISFRVKQPQGPREIMNPAKKARGPFVSARELVMEVGKSLPSARMHELMILLDQLKGGEINTGDFFIHIRSIVGDKVLSTFANKIRGH